MSKGILNVGATGTGKTSEVVKILQSVNFDTYIFDFQREAKYKPFKNLWDVNNLSFEDFLINTQGKKKSCFVFEEASIFLKHTAKKKNLQRALDELLVGKRHANNLVIFNFHSLRRVPLELLDFTDLLILGKTTDNPAHIEHKFGEYIQIWNAFNQVRQSTDIHVHKYVQLGNSIAEGN
jgi:hypothetical protein